MPCYYPNLGYFDGINPKPFLLSKVSIPDKQRLVRSNPTFYKLLKCTQCTGCRLDSSRKKGVRAVHEAMCYSNNCFINLTYNTESLMSPSLIHRDFQLFAKRFRDRCTGFDCVEHKGKLDFSIRIMMCGEYGEQYLRPHFHACIFNFDFLDRYFWKKTKLGFNLYRSPLLEDLWTHGNSCVGALSYDSAAYVARYCTKKVNGEMAASHYDGRVPEYGQMPSKYGMGLKFLEKYYKDIYPADRIVVSTKDGDFFTMKPPKYYDDKLLLIDPKMHQLVQEQREKKYVEEISSFDFKKLEIKAKKEQKGIKELIRTLDEVQ